MVKISCPNCGAHELEGKNCAYCGAQLLQEAPEIEIEPFMEKDSYEIPVGEYKGTNCKVILEENGFVISRSGDKKRVRILYGELHSLLFCRPKDKFGAWGHIIIRWAGNANLPLPAKKLRDAAAGKENESIITFSLVAERVFIQIFWFLMSKSPYWVECGIENSDEMALGTKAFLNSIDFDAYFKKYNPYRGQAIVALMQDTKLRRKPARNMIYQAFDERQKELYRHEPSMAVRDLNRLVRQAIRERWTWVIDM